MVTSRFFLVLVSHPGYRRISEEYPTDTPKSSLICVGDTPAQDVKVSLWFWLVLPEKIDFASRDDLQDRSIHSGNRSSAPQQFRSGRVDEVDANRNVDTRFQGTPPSPASAQELVVKARENTTCPVSALRVTYFVDQLCVIIEHDFFETGCLH
jgi:hypothetical protein